jgi:hypothetical protein
MKKVIRKDKIKNTWVVVLGAFFFSGWVLFGSFFRFFILIINKRWEVFLVI